MANILKSIMKNTASGAKHSKDKLVKSAFTAPFDIAMGGIFGGAIAGVTGLGRGVIGAKSGLAATNLFTAIPQAAGYTAGKLGVGVAKPILSVGAHLTKNTPQALTRAGHMFGNAGNALFHAGFKKSTKAGAHSIAGYEARAGLGLVLGAGAIGVGLAKSAESHDYKMAARSAVNGRMDTEGVAVTHGSINETYTPVAPRGKKVRDFGATGAVPLAAHNSRQG